MPRPGIPKNYLQTPPTIFIADVKARSAERGVVPHRPSYWKNRAVDLWNKEPGKKGHVSDKKKANWWNRQKEMTKVIRCNTGPTWMWKNCTNQTAARLKEAKTFYRKHKKKGECLDVDEMQEFGCKGRKLARYISIYDEKYSKRTQIKDKINSKKKEVDAKRKIIIQANYLRGKMTTKNLSFNRFNAFHSAWMKLSQEWNDNFDTFRAEKGGLTPKEEQWAHNIQTFNTLFIKIGKKLTKKDGNFNWLLGKDIFPLMKGYPEKNPNAEEKVMSILKKKQDTPKSVSLKRKAPGESPKKPTKVTTNKKPSTSKTPVVLTPKKKTTATPKKKPAATPSPPAEEEISPPPAKKQKKPPATVTPKNKPATEKEVEHPPPAQRQTFQMPEYPQMDSSLQDPTEKRKDYAKRLHAYAKKMTAIIMEDKYNVLSEVVRKNAVVNLKNAVKTLSVYAKGNGQFLTPAMEEDTRRWNQLYSNYLAAIDKLPAGYRNRVNNNIIQRYLFQFLYEYEIQLADPNLDPGHLKQFLDEMKVIIDKHNPAEEGTSPPVSQPSPSKPPAEKKTRKPRATKPINEPDVNQVTKSGFRYPPEAGFKSPADAMLLITQGKPADAFDFEGTIAWREKVFDLVKDAYENIIRGTDMDNLLQYEKVWATGVDRLNQVQKRADLKPKLSAPKAKELKKWTTIKANVDLVFNSIPIQQRTMVAADPNRMYTIIEHMSEYHHVYLQQSPEDWKSVKNYLGLS
jgi:hypothetical protein